MPHEFKLLPCPFCGGAPALRKTVEMYAASHEGPAGEFDGRFSVDCDNCGISIGEEYQDDAIEAWNRRAPTTDPKTPELERAA